MKMNSTMEHRFSEVPKAEIQRSVFNRTHGLKTTFNAGDLVPIFIDEAVPGDQHIVDLTAFARMNTPIVPIMDNLKMDYFFFSVPNRLLWENWEKMMGSQDDPGDSIDYILPTVNVKSEQVGSLSDYFGLPINKTNDVNVQALYHRAYNLIWNEWFRDQNLQDSLPENVGDGPDDIGDYTLKKRGKRHDYFTSALTAPQKGDAIELPLGQDAPVVTTGVSPNFDYGAYTNQPLGVVYGASDADVRLAGTTGSPSGLIGTAFGNETGLKTRLDQATSATINSIREAFQFQRMLEKDARGGTRYVEIIKSHFNVTSPDFRLQRPEYLGGGSFDVNVNPVAQTSSTDATTPQANLSAFATTTGKVNFNATFTEHCVVIGLVSVRADLTYQEGIDKPFLRSTRYDFYWPTLAHLGEQPIEMQEIYFDDVTPDNNTNVWGYQEAYASYRYKPSKITGQFRSSAPTNYDEWHLAQYFDTTPPALNGSFIEENPPMGRIMAVNTEPDFLYDSFVRVKSVRPMPVFGVPGLIDHF